MGLLTRAVATGLLITLSFFVVSSLGDESRYNVVFLYVDDLRPTLSSYGDPFAQTPHIDSLLQSGVRFNNAHVTFPACAPSRTAMLTGRRNDVIRSYDFDANFRSRNPLVKTLPSMLRDVGYKSVAVGKVLDARSFFPSGLSDAEKVDGPDTCDKAGVECSFDTYFTPEVIRVNSAALCGTEAQRYPGKSGSQDKKILLVYKSAAGTDQYYRDHCTTTVAIDQMNQLVTDGSPFFLSVGWVLPHLPWVAPLPYFELYDGISDAELEAEYVEGDSDKFWKNQGSDATRRSNSELTAYSGDEKVDTADRIRAYLACTSFIDTQVGRFMSAFRELDQTVQENTLIVFWSDHGFHLGHNDMWGKWNLYEESTRIPLGIIPPITFPQTIRIGESVAAPVETLDIVPTVLDMVGLAPVASSGTSLLPLLKDPNSFVRAAAVTQLQANDDGDSMGYSIRTAKYRMIIFSKTFNSDRSNGKVQYNTDEFRNSVVELYHYKTGEDRELKNVYDNGNSTFDAAAQEILKLWECRTDTDWSCLIGVKPFDLVIPPPTKAPTKTPTLMPTNKPQTASPVGTSPTMSNVSPSPSPTILRPSPDDLEAFHEYFNIRSNESSNDVYIATALRDIGATKGTWDESSQTLTFTLDNSCSLAQSTSLEDLLHDSYESLDFAAFCLPPKSAEATSNTLVVLLLLDTTQPTVSTENQLREGDDGINTSATVMVVVLVVLTAVVILAGLVWKIQNDKIKAGSDNGGKSLRDIASSEASEAPPSTELKIADS